jgi:hypothetical protein
MRREFKTPVFQVTEKLPRPGRCVFVITSSYRCLGYIDDKGTWRSAYRRQMIEGVKAWSAATEEETTLFSRKLDAQQ